MCGIMGYIGQKQAQDVLVNGLARLEYRGYDSAGVAVLSEGKIAIRKSKGRLKILQDSLIQSPIPGTMGIGHTRWATHGEPSDLNAHPHTDVKGSVAVVHNGIIENHQELREWLQNEGCVFCSQTDTEVIAHLLNYLYKGDMLSAIQQAMHRLHGSYALGIVSVSEPDRFFCVRKDSPLIVGLGQGEQFIASDIPALLPYTRQVLFLKDMEIGCLTREGVTLYDELLQEISREPYHVNWDVSSAEKGGYEHFMLKEIHEEPDALRATMTPRLTQDGAIKQSEMPLSAEQAKALKKMTIVACGTAYHAGVIGRYAIERFARLPVEVDIASEYRYRDPFLSKDDLFLVISQSGETADTLAALREAKKRGAHVLALTNVVGSTISREAEGGVMYTWAGPEIAVASTKAYITQVEMLILLALDLGKKRGTIDEQTYRDMLASLGELPRLAQRAVAERESIQRFVSRVFDKKNVFFIGRGLDYALSMEASLKLKEVSYVMSEAYAAGELKHGTIALIEEGTLVVGVCTQKDLLQKTLSNLQEVKARGAELLIVCPESLSPQCEKLADTVWRVPDAPDAWLPLLAIIPLQMFAYYMAVYRDCDVDKPRNLAKSVTVE